MLCIGVEETVEGVEARRERQSAFLALQQPFSKPPGCISDALSNRVGRCHVQRKVNTKVNNTRTA
jgi:hypothetical protein